MLKNVESNKSIKKDSPLHWRFPRQGKWTYEDWVHFPDDGWKYEIIDGVLHMTPAPAINHQRTFGKLFTAMFIYAESNKLGEVLSAPCDVLLPGQPVPVEPDILFIQQNHLEIIKDTYVEGVPDLVVEILSPSNAQYDRETKFNLYEKVGINEYWLVDYKTHQVEVYNLTKANYTLTGKYISGQIVTSTRLAGFKIAVQTIFNY